MRSDDDIPVVQFVILFHHLFAITIILHSNISILPITIPNGVKDIRTVHQQVCCFFRYRSTSTEISYL